MMAGRLLICFFLAAVLLSACQRPADPDAGQPISADSVLSPEKMIDLLTDIYIAEADFQLEREAGAKPVYEEAVYKGIFEKHGTTAVHYQASLAVYRKEMSDYIRICDSVAARLKKLRDAIPAEE